MGDNLIWEIAVPRELGFYTVWVDRAGRGVPVSHRHAPPHRIIASIQELTLLSGSVAKATGA